MIPFDARSVNEASAAPGDAALEPRRGTLPPPEWKPSVMPGRPAMTPATTSLSGALPRRLGTRADEAWMRARVADALQHPSDAATLKAASLALARWLASRDRDLDEAVELATSVLSLEDIELRREVSAWLESLGESARAAAALKPIASMADVESAEAAYVLVRAGVLQARAGLAAGAAAAFEAAATIEPADPLPLELLGALSAWPDEEIVSAEVAAEAYVEAARRRAAALQADAELEDLWRAVAVDAASESAANELIKALEARGRLSAADEARRTFSLTSGVGLPATGLAGALDRGMDGEAGGDETGGGETFDALLVDAGLEDVWVREGAGTATTPPAVLERVAGAASPAVATLLLSVASNRYLALGDSGAARAAAERAVAADPKSTRSVAALADAVEPGPDRRVLAALEHAIALVGPRARWCAALADTLDALGEAGLAVGWTQRCVELRPGDRGAIDALLQRLVRAGDPSRLGDALAWLLSQPQPVAWMARPFATALRALGLMDADRAAVVARRTLDVLGPQSEFLRDAMSEVAALASDDAFAAAIQERWLCSGADAAERPRIFDLLADLRQRLGDDESTARVVARAMQEGPPSAEIQALVVKIADQPASPDAQLWRMRAMAMQVAAGDDRPAAAVAWRDLGGALWDLADDRDGALDAWREAAHAAGTRGYTTFAGDLVAFAGVEFAVDHFARWVEIEEDDAAASAIAVGASRAVLDAGETRIAFDLAARGVARSPLNAEALELAERSARGEADLAALSALYDLVAGRALGRFGRRAAHYRGARFFERSAENALALKHAAQAFYAVPSEGSGFHLLARAAERAGNHAHAMRTVERVAENAPHADVRTAWFLRAATLAGDGVEGAERRLSVLLRAASISPSPAVVERVRDATRELMGFGPAEDDRVEARIHEAMRAIGERLSGPDGARVAIACAKALLELFADPEAGLSFVERAFACDADVDEFDALLPWGPALGLTKGAGERISALVTSGESAFANLGAAALRLLATVAGVLRDDMLRARIAVTAATRDPDEALLVVEADAAVRGFPALADVLAKRVSPRVRAEALCTVARSRFKEGAHADAAALFERALDLLEPAARLEIESELRAAWDAAGRGAETEARVEEEAAAEGTSPAIRADRWMEVAERREARRDTAAAVRALVEACKLDPEPLDRWSALERVAEIAGDDVARVEAMEAIAVRVDARGRVAVFKRLARVHERSGDLAAAEHAWLRVLALDPHDEEADHALESIVVGRGRFDELADHLKRRAERLGAQSEKREVLRAVRLRLAAILEQRLGRVEEACEELGVLLAEWPDNPGALRYLADLFDRQGEVARSAPLWSRAAAVEMDAAGRAELELKAARAFLAAGDVAGAQEHASRTTTRHPPGPELLALRVDVARAAGADRELGEALEALASAGGLDGVRVGDVLLEAAQAAARVGDSALALDRSRRAAGIIPERATPQLLARGLEYRLRGPGTPDEARQTIIDLGRIREQLDGPDAALRAFLFAEALDVGQDQGAGLQELESARSTLGDHPLIALGLAERYAAQGVAPAAVDAYSFALSGSLLDLRNAGGVALAAAEVAIHAHRFQDAARFLDRADADDESRAAAQVARARLIERATAAVRPAPSPPPAPPPPVDVEPGDPMLAELEAAVRSAGSPVARASARLALGKIRLERGDVRGAESLLWEALADGLTEAGDILGPVIAASPDRARDHVRLRRQLVAIEPGDIGRLEALRAAAMADDDRVYAAAVEHVLRAFDPSAGPLAPPPLGAQPEQPGIFALLTRPSLDAAGEALAAIWEGAMHLFLREPASYGITGVERVAPGTSSTVARQYEIVMRVLDLPRIPIFVPRSAGGAPASQVALLSPPSVILTGDARDEAPELFFAIGYGLSATLPQNVLRLGLPRAEGRALVEALHAAFGPPEIGRRVDARAARLAQSFWQTMPSRTQRRLQQILSGGPLGEYEDLVSRAHQSGLRAGMFLAGDFGWAVRHLLAETPGRESTEPTTATLRGLCDELPMLADLLRLAVSPEYADARWHSAPPGVRPGTLSSRGYRLF